MNSKGATNSNKIKVATVEDIYNCTCLGYWKNVLIAVLFLYSGCPRRGKTWNPNPKKPGIWGQSVRTINSFHLFSISQLFLFALLVTLHYLLANVKDKSHLRSWYLYFDEYMYIGL